MTAGAYGAVQAGTYNTRALVPEVLVNGAEWALVRPRLDADALIALDRMPNWLSRRLFRCGRGRIVSLRLWPK